MIALSMELSLEVDKILNYMGFPREKAAADENYCVFNIEEIEKVDKLEIENFTTLDGIEKLPNLKNLEIFSIPYQKITYDVDLETNWKVNKIKDFSAIENLKKLETLSIKNDFNIKELNIENLKNLKKLNIENSPHLEKLEGLDKITKLEEVFIYGTNISNEIDILRYIENTFQAEKNVLDVNMYPKLVEKDEKLPKSIDELQTLGLTRLRFAEQIGMLDYAILSTYNLKDLYTWSRRTIKRKKLDETDDFSKIKSIYDLVVNNVEFADEKLKERYRLYKAYNGIPSFAKRNFAMIHTSYSAAMFKNSNCEGYVNLMKFMLNMLNIKSHNVHCTSVTAEDTTVLNHSSIRINLDDKWFYFDPSWEKKGEHKYFMKSKKDFMETHILNALEREIGDFEYENEFYNNRNIRKK